MRLVVDRAKCSGVGLCEAEAPDLFEVQDDDYQESVLPVDLPTVSVEAGIRQGWERYADAIVSIDRFGASAPGALVLEKLGITPENVADNVRELLG